MARFLGIDYGARRIGVAVGDDDTNMASPVTTIATGGGTGPVAALVALAREYGAEAFVVGLALRRDGSEGDQAKATRAFGDRLARAADLPVHFWDERLSSHAAGELLRPAAFTHKKKKKRLDRVAAQIILQGFLDSRALG